MRKASLARLLARHVDGIFLSDFQQGEIGPDLFRHACLMRLEGMVSTHRGSTYRDGRFRHWIKVKNRQHPVQQGSGSVLKQRGTSACDALRSQRTWIHCRLRENFGIADHQSHLTDRVPAGTHRGDGDQTRPRASQTWRITAMQAPKKRTSLNGHAALKLMRLCGARRADQAASDARVTNAVSSIAVALLLISSGASATECQSSPGHDGKWWSFRIVDSKRCWYQGRPGRSKDLLRWAKQSPPPVVTRPDPGYNPHTAPPVPPQQAIEIVNPTPKVVPAVSIPAPTSEAPSLPEPPPLPAKRTKPSKWWMLLLIIPAIATALAVVASHFLPARKERRQGILFKNFRRRWTNWQARLAGQLDLMGDNITRWSRRASRPVQVDPTSPSSEKPSPRPWYRRRNTPITPASFSSRPSGSLTTFDPKPLR